MITDVCVDEYTDHGHCGVLKPRPRGELEVDNDATLEILAKAAVVHATAGRRRRGAERHDGRPRRRDPQGARRRRIRGYRRSSRYAVKYASRFYGPFREAADCAPKFGDRAGYQMDPANAREALREATLDEDEGADMLMVKPALPYLDVVRARARRPRRCRSAPTT